MIAITAPEHRAAFHPYANESNTAPYRAYHAYESAKHAWRQQHPYATAQQYGAAMRELADTLGV